MYRWLPLLNWVVLDRSVLVFPCSDIPQLPPKGKMRIAQSCLTHCDPKACSPPGSSVPGILQARIVEWVAMPSSWGSSQSRDRTHVSMSPALAGRVFTTRTTREAIPFSRESPPRDRTWVSRTAGRLFTLWVTRQSLLIKGMLLLQRWSPNATMELDLKSPMWHFLHTEINT